MILIHFKLNSLFVDFQSARSSRYWIKKNLILHDILFFFFEIVDKEFPLFMPAAVLAYFLGKHKLNYSVYCIYKNEAILAKV